MRMSARAFRRRDGGARYRIGHNCGCCGKTRSAFQRRARLPWRHQSLEQKRRRAPPAGSWGRHVVRDGRAFLTNAATYAELERNLISERTREALSQIKEKGATLSSALGFRYEKGEDGTAKLVESEEESVSVERCRDLRAQGLTLRQVADRLNAEGLPTKRGGKWHARRFGITARKLLRSALKSKISRFDV